MISYNTKDWFTFIFRFNKGDTVRKLFAIMIAIGLYSALSRYLEIEVWKLAEKSFVKNITIIHGMLGFVISLLLVFRTNTAYNCSREGLKMSGSLVNNSRNLANKLSAILKEEQDRTYFINLIPEYANLLHKHLKNDETVQQLFDNLNLEIDHHKHKPNQVAKMLFSKINDLYE
jgi:putative membrane protein